VAEAMAMEKPVVATDVGGTRELMGDSGVMVPPKAPDALAEAMMEVMGRTAEERHRLGVAERERICQSFNIDTKADEWEALYLTVVESKR